MRLVDTRAYVGMLRELVEQGKEVRMVISGSSMAPFLIHGRDSIFFCAPERVTQVERKGKRLAPGSFWWGFFEKVWIRMIPLRPMGNRIYRLLQGKRPAHRENEREKT